MPALPSPPLSLPPLLHRVFGAGQHTVPAPFSALALRSDEAPHAFDARAPYGHVHLLRPSGLDAATLAALASDGRARMAPPAFPDIDHAPTSRAALAAAAPGAVDVLAAIASALSHSGVLGDQARGDASDAGIRIDYLGANGAGFHNDVGRHWSRCLFWLLALDLHDVEFVMPHAGLRLPLAAGDLLVFDPCMAHGLCRPGDAGQAVAASFDGGPGSTQCFLTGELLLDDAQWQALGAPWLPVEAHAARGALDLMVADFDERSGAIKRPAGLRQCMQRSVCHVDAPAPPAAATSGQATAPPAA